MSISGNVEAGKAAAPIYELCEETAAELIDPQAFWRKMKEFAESKLPESPVVGGPSIMTDEQARHFEVTLVPFGKYAGETVKSVPLEYLIWLSEQKDAFKEHLRAYIRSKRVQSEIEEPNS